MILKRVKSTIENHKLLLQGESIIVGVSGGADSIALLDILNKLSREEQLGLKISIAHINHLLRGEESDEDERFVQEISKKYSCQFFLKRADVSKIAAEQKRSIEEVGREIRLNFFSEVCKRLNAKRVATAHHRDDLAETVLHRIIRGTGIKGLSGFAPETCFQNLILIKPLISISKNEILKYCQENDLHFREDSTNYSDKYLRNRIRHDLFPYLEKNFNKKIRKSLVNIATIASDFNEFVEQEAYSFLKSSSSIDSEGNFWIRIKPFKEIDKALRTTALYSASVKSGCVSDNLTSKHIEDLEALLFKNAGKEVELPGKIIAVREYKKIKFYRDVQVTEKLEEFEIKIPGESVSPDKSIKIVTEIIEGGKDFLKEFIREKNRFAEILDFEKVNPPIIVRSRKTGDRFKPLGQKGTKKLKDYFIDKKVPKKWRDRIPIVCDSDGIIWLPGHIISQRVKITLETKRILRLEHSSL